MAQRPPIAPRFFDFRRLLLSALALVLVLAGTSGIAFAVSERTSGSAISARLSKKSFTASQASSVKLTCKFSKTSGSFSYLLTLKKGSKWQTVKSVKKKSYFKGSFATTAKKVFAGKSVKVGSYRLKLSTVGGSKLLTFKVVKSAKPATKPDDTPNAPVGDAPVNISLPTISGTARQGQTLTVSNGGWQDAASFAYQWRRCDSAGNSCSNIFPSGTSKSYLLQTADIGHTIRVLVTGSNASGYLTAVSNQTAVVVGHPPANTTPPVISGTPTQLETLSVSTGSWWYSPTSFHYQWYSCDESGDYCYSIFGATSSTHKLTIDDVFGTVRVVVTGTNAYGSGSVTTAPSPLIAEGPVPENLTAPTISGTGNELEPLTVTSPGTWTNNPTSYEYYWWGCSDDTYADCWDLNSVSSPTYTPDQWDGDTVIGVTVVASNAYGSAYADSNSIGPIVLGPIPENTSIPTVSGEAQPGETLTASTGTWTNDPTSYEYWWWACTDDTLEQCSDLNDVSSKTYQLTNNEIGRVVGVTVVAGNYYGIGFADSDPTVRVGRPIVVEDPTISGEAKAGRTLTVTTGVWRNSPTLNYKWWACTDSTLSDCEDLTSFGWDNTYVTKLADVDSVIGATVRAFNSAGTASADAEVTSPIVGSEPILVTSPSISGFAIEGHILTADHGYWSLFPTSYAYQWQRCNAAGDVCSDVSGANAVTYHLTTTDIGYRLRIAVVAANTYGDSAPSYTEITPIVRGVGPSGGWIDRSISGMTENLTQIRFADSDHALIGGEIMLLSTANGGSSWEQHPGYSISDLSYINDSGTYRGYGVGSGWDFYKTDDGGSTWYGEGVWDFTDIRGLDYVDANHGWAVDGYGKVFFSPGGRAAASNELWWEQSVNPTIRLIDVDFFDINHGLAVGYNGAIRTSDGGTTWTTTSLDSQHTLILRGISMADATHGWAVGYERISNDAPDRGVIYATADGGITWTDQGISPVDPLNSVDFVDSTHGWAVGNSGTILYTGNGGSTWTLQNSETTKDLIGVDALRSNNAWLVGEDGTIRSTTTGGVAP